MKIVLTPLELCRFDLNFIDSIKLFLNRYDIYGIDRICYGIQRIRIESLRLFLNLYNLIKPEWFLLNQYDFNLIDMIFM